MFSFHHFWISLIPAPFWALHCFWTLFIVKIFLRVFISPGLAATPNDDIVTFSRNNVFSQVYITAKMDKRHSRYIFILELMIFIIEVVNTPDTLEVDNPAFKVCSQAVVECNFSIIEMDIQPLIFILSILNSEGMMVIQ